MPEKNAPTAPYMLPFMHPVTMMNVWRGVASPYVLRDFTHSLVGDFSGHLPHISNSRERGADSAGVKAKVRVRTMLEICGHCSTHPATPPEHK